MDTSTGAGHRAGAPARALLCAAAVVSACSGASADLVADVDGGSRGVALLGDVSVAAEPGSTFTIRHDGARSDDEHDTPVAHAFVGGVDDQLPPLFVRARDGLTPNPAVWGQCRGGAAADADGTCPVPPAEGPQQWDGQVYWSTGAMLPGEMREVPLAHDVADQTVLTCALHPELRVVAGAEASPGAAHDPEQRVAAALEVPVPADAGDHDHPVTAGATVASAYVGRFFPDRTVVDVGETVTWRPGGRAPVDVVFNDNDLDLTHTDPEDGVPAGKASAWNGRGTLRSGFLSNDPAAGAAATQWSVTFIRPGTYTYASRFGAELHGTVVVRRR